MAMKRTGRMPTGEGAVFYSVGVVAAPKCGACGAEMAAASATEWQCSDPSCTENGKPVRTGVFPIRDTP